MTSFAGFNNMREYFMEMEKPPPRSRSNRSMEMIELAEKESLERIGLAEKESLERIGLAEIEFMKTSRNMNIKLEFANTGKIQCAGHFHRTINAYRGCAKKNEFVPMPTHAYFVDVLSDTFDKNQNILMDMFPEKMKKNIIANDRYTTYKLFYKKVLLMESIVAKKKEKYQNILHSLQRILSIDESEFSDDPVDDLVDDPIDDPIDEPSVEPSIEPSVEPSIEPSVEPSDEPEIDRADEPEIDRADDRADDRVDDPYDVPIDVRTTKYKTRKVSPLLKC